MLLRLKRASHTITIASEGNVVSSGASARPDYALGHSIRELERLSAQARMFDSFTRQVLAEAGVSEGMRVLDVGSGNGDTALLLASIVGPRGSVVAIDRSPEAVDAARVRARSVGAENVTFLAADVMEAQFPRGFDAAFGRLVLMYCPDPVAALKKLATLTHSGGLVVFQEFDFAGARTWPESALFERVLGWMEQAFVRTGADIRMGMRLHASFVAAGLPVPGLRLDAAIGSGPGHPAYTAIAEVTRSLLPVLAKFGIASAAEVDADTLRDRLEADLVSKGGAVVAPNLIGAWSRVP
jgi:SAM-dependent methyltransferase